MLVVTFRYYFSPRIYSVDYVLGRISPGLVDIRDVFHTVGTAPKLVTFGTDRYLVTKHDIVRLFNGYSYFWSLPNLLLPGWLTASATRLIVGIALLTGGLPIPRRHVPHRHLTRLWTVCRSLEELLGRCAVRLLRW